MGSQSSFKSLSFLSAVGGQNTEIHGELKILPGFPFRVCSISTGLSDLLGFKPQELRTLRSLFGPRTKVEAFDLIFQDFIDDRRCERQIVLYCKDGKEIEFGFEGLSMETFDGVTSCCLSAKLLFQAAEHSTPLESVTDFVNYEHQVISSGPPCPDSFVKDSAPVLFSSNYLDFAAIVHLNAIRRSRKQNFI
jgi:hypothetical protein